MQQHDSRLSSIPFFSYSTTSIQSLQKEIQAATSKALHSIRNFKSNRFQEDFRLLSAPSFGEISPIVSSDNSISDFDLSFEKSLPKVSPLLSSLSETEDFNSPAPKKRDLQSFTKKTLEYGIKLMPSFPSNEESERKMRQPTQAKKRRHSSSNESPVRSSKTFLNKDTLIKKSEFVTRINKPKFSNISANEYPKSITINLEEIIAKKKLKIGLTKPAYTSRR